MARVIKLSEKFPNPYDSWEYHLLDGLMEPLCFDRDFTFFFGRTPDDVMREAEVWLWIEEGKTPWETAAIAYGHIQITDPIHKAHVARLGVCVHPAHRQNGWGTQVVGRLIQEAQAMGLKKLVATVFADNKAMLHIYHDKFGFKIEGHYRREECWEGEYRDILSLARFLDNEPEEEPKERIMQVAGQTIASTSMPMPSFGVSNYGS